MKRWRKTLAALSVLAVGACAAVAQDLPRLGEDPTSDVVAALTTEEKVGLVIGTGMPLPGLPPAMQGPVVGEPSEGVPGAAGTTARVARLGIPSIVLADGPAGLRIQPQRPDTERTYHCTAFPIATLLASSWDLDLAERVGRAIGNEVREYGVDVWLAPALNIHRNPLGGRNFEYYSEDPLVSGRMAAAMTRGVQFQGVGVALKHYVANNHEWNRSAIDVVVSERALREIYLRGFEIAVREGRPWAVMSSYNKVNGTYTSESAELLEGVLHHDWGFDGLVMTDWFGGSDTIVQMRAGNELLMPGTSRQQQALMAALESGALSEEVLDRNVATILDVVRRSPAFEGHAHSDAPDLEAHAALSRAAAAEGMVLLRNEGVLPLRAGSKLALFGNASYRTIIGGTGSGDVNEAYSISLREGLEAAGVETDAALAVSYASYVAEQEAARPRPATPFLPVPPIPEMRVADDEIDRLARETDLALLTIGRNSGEFRDRELEDDFELSAIERDLLGAVAEAFGAEGKKLLVVLNVGGVIETASWRDRAHAILLAWQPGQEAGHAITDVLTGRTPPSGRLATTFPVAWADVPSSANFPGERLQGAEPQAAPLLGDRAARVVYEDDIWVGYRHFATRGVKPAYPFGFGLSYTTFEHSKLELDDDGRVVRVSVEVTNTGEAAGREVVQLYLAAPGADKPALELRAFAKTRTLEPGESQTLAFTLTGRDLASFDSRSLAWVADTGTYTVKVGASSADVRQTATFDRVARTVIESVSTSVGARPGDESSRGG